MHICLKIFTFCVIILRHQVLYNFEIICFILTLENSKQYSFQKGFQATFVNRGLVQFTDQLKKEGTPDKC